MKITTPLSEKLKEYVSEVQKLVNKNWEDMKFTYQPAPKIETIEGSRYIKVIVVDYSNSGVKTGRSVHTFVDKTNGDILKGTWKAPVKNGVRGNIFNEICTQGVNHHGAIYLR